MPNNDTYLECNQCQCILDINVFPKCLFCKTIKKCIGCTRSDNILAVENIIILVCDNCIKTYDESMLNNLHKTDVKISKTELTKKIHKLKSYRV